MSSSLISSSERRRVSGIITIVNTPTMMAAATSKPIVPLSPIVLNSTGNRKALIDARSGA
jgi:hypothetical protein